MVREYNLNSAGGRLRLLRHTNSQQDFAKRLGVSFSAYQNYEYDKRMPPDSMLEKIEEELNVPREWVLTGKFSVYELTDLQDVKDLIELDKKTRKTLIDKLRLADIYRRSHRAYWSRRIKHEKEFKQARDDKRFARDKVEFQKYIELLEVHDKDIELWDLFTGLAEIYEGGDRQKIEAVKTFLDALRPVKPTHKK